MAALGRLAPVAAVLALALAACGGSDRPTTPSVPKTSSAIATPSAGTAAAAPSPAHRRAEPSRARAHAPFAVRLRVLTFVDEGRRIRLPSGRQEPRTLVTAIRYPAPARGGGPGGPFPLIVFGHGFAVTPEIYAPLLQAWASAGYVVAAPAFPLSSAGAPGGPDESDLVNQPGDMSFVISSMLRASAARAGFLAGLVDPRRVAISGQSDGGETALAAAYDRPFLDRRVRAAVILSGAAIPGIGGFDFPAPSPPLLATQGTADTINPPDRTRAFFDLAPAPKFLLTLLGASHLGPYTGEQPQLRIVERVTIAFLDRYLKRAPGALRRLTAAGDVAGTSAVQADP